jgi:hypothetical protein
MNCAWSHARQRRQDRLGIRHLRHALGIHETRHFDARAAGVDQAADELDLRGGRQTCDSLCRPSRGPTSTISMRVGFMGANSNV